jgi:putative DNA primase/helicase
MRGDLLTDLIEARGPDEGLPLARQLVREYETALNGSAPTSSSLIPFSEIEAKPVRWAWRDRIALSKLTALAGRPKVGKGLLYSHKAAEVTRGKLAGDLTAPRDVILVTTEDEPGDTLKPRLMAAGADLSRVSIFQMGSREEPVPFRVPQDADELGRRVAETSAALVVIDPLIEFIDGKVDSHKSHPVRQAVAALNTIARAHGCAVLVILHLNKGASSDPLLRHEGSAAFTQIVRGGLMLGNDPDDPEGDSGSQRVLAVSASNLAPITTSLVYRIDSATVTGDTGEKIETARMVQTGESGASGSDLLRGQDDEDRDAISEARDFLLGVLEDGPVPVADIKGQARAANIAWRTVERAKPGVAESYRPEGERYRWSMRLIDSAKGVGGLDLADSTEPPETASQSHLQDRAQSRPPIHNGGGLDADRHLPTAAEVQAIAREGGLEVVP